MLFCHSPCLKNIAEIIGFTRNTRKGKSQFGLLPASFYPHGFLKKAESEVRFHTKKKCSAFERVIL